MNKTNQKPVFACEVCGKTFQTAKAALRAAAKGCEVDSIRSLSLKRTN